MSTHYTITVVREILRDHARLPVDVATLGDTQNLYETGMTSHATIHVMLALEEGFNVEFPDKMLSRGVFESVSSITAAIGKLDPANAG